MTINESKIKTFSTLQLVRQHEFNFRFNFEGKFTEFFIFFLSVKNFEGWEFCVEIVDILMWNNSSFQ